MREGEIDLCSDEYYMFYPIDKPEIICQMRSFEKNLQAEPHDDKRPLSRLYFINFGKHLSLVEDKIIQK